MLIAFLLLGLFVGAVTAAVTIAMLRGVWLKVEIDQRVTVDHRLHVDPVYPEPTAYVLDGHIIAGSVLHRAVLPRRTTRPVHHVPAPREIEP